MTTMTKTQPRFINNRVYPIACCLGNEHIVIQPGEIVEGEKFWSSVDIRKGLIAYDGPRSIGPMVNVSMPKSENSIPLKNTPRASDAIPGLMTPRVDGAIATDKMPINYAQDKFLGKNVAEWLEQAKKSGLSELSRGSVIGLGRFLGLNVAEQASKQEITTCVIDNLKRLDREQSK